MIEFDLVLTKIIKHILDHSPLYLGDIILMDNTKET